MWSCDGPACKDVGEGTFPEKSRCLIIRASWKHWVTKREEEERKRRMRKWSKLCYGKVPMCPLCGWGKVQQRPLWRLFQAQGSIYLAPGTFKSSIAGIPVTQGGNNEVSCSSQDSLFWLPVTLMTTSSQEEPSLRRSGREPRPSALRAGEEWEVLLMESSIVEKLFSTL